jgi:hypothetical protein
MTSGGLVRGDGGAGVGKGLIGDRRRLPGAGLDHDIETELLVFLYCVRRDGNTTFVGAPLLRYGHFHGGGPVTLG